MSIEDDTINNELSNIIEQNIILEEIDDLKGYMEFETDPIKISELKEKISMLEDSLVMFRIS